MSRTIHTFGKVQIIRVHEEETGTRHLFVTVDRWHFCISTRPVWGLRFFQRGETLALDGHWPSRSINLRYLFYSWPTGPREGNE